MRCEDPSRKRWPSRLRRRFGMGMPSRMADSIMPESSGAMRSGHSGFRLIALYHHPPAEVHGASWAEFSHWIG